MRRGNNEKKCNGVSPSNAYAGTIDNTLSSNANSAANYGSSGYNTVGLSSGNVFRPIVKFDISSVAPSNVTVVDAYLTVTLHSTMSNTLNAYAITTYWDEMESTWDSSQTGISWTIPGGGGDLGALQDSKYISSKTMTFKLSPALVQSWITSPSTNYGILLKVTDETLNRFTNVYSRKYTTITERPQLTIYYTLP